MKRNIAVLVANSNAQLKDIFEVRRLVFVEEQMVDEEEEYDEFETSSTHLIAMLDSKPVGTCRYRNTEKGIKLERFAVLKEARSLGVGAHLLEKCLEEVDTSLYVYLHAQIQVVDFYAKFGFVKTGPLFVEANIKHYKMVLTPAKS